MAIKRLLRLPEVLSRRPEGRSVFYQGVKDGILPQPVQVSTRISSYQEHEVTQSIDLDIAASTLSDKALVRWVASYVADQEQTYGPMGGWFANRVHYHQTRDRRTTARHCGNDDVGSSPSHCAA